ncbi:hypothetical protein A2V71_03805 [Candidatus Berkelbacteria bacterium RBG_13_40_8]|uniref:Uncharacterized protein n=1 Tax=Candidatus Berkelbacteria bacterium RBG_13_40_8 TaxID=1797467 RepID=A0A1F5DLS7_9BACT|nr:MAG: hypothetical protein A2V71_03805 [Candidatus Berkelbacteria bacterium RBG_13_40_8]
MRVPNGFNGDVQMINQALAPVRPSKVVGCKPKGNLTVLIRFQQIEQPNGSKEPKIISIPGEKFSGKRDTIIKNVKEWKQGIGLSP